MGKSKEEIEMNLKRVIGQWRHELKNLYDLQQTFAKEDNFCMAANMQSKSSQLLDCINELKLIFESKKQKA